MPSREDEFYEVATREVAEKQLLPAIWGKAFSQALGDNQVALVLYIKLRVEQLERDYQERRRESEKARQTTVEKEINNFASGCLLIIAFGAAVAGLVWIYSMLSK